MALQNVISDNSFKNLKYVPEQVLNMVNLRMLYLDGNSLKSLPLDFFERLPKLYWLDLRGNKLKEIPVGVGNHKFLENLLLQHNRIEKLPNELGLVPNLKVLQLTDNPLIYPPKDVLEHGVLGICNFLKKAFYKKQDSPLKEQRKEDETLTSSPSGTSASSPSYHPVQKKSSKKLPKPVPPVIVTSLSKPVPAPENRGDAGPKDKKMHRISRSSSRLSVHSHYSTNTSWGVINAQVQDKRIEEQRIKDMWLDKLRSLIKDQEKILQQERTLMRLSSWRQEKKEEPPRSASKEMKRVPESPFDTNAAYNQLMSRDHAVVKNVERLISTQNRPPAKVDVDKLINDVVVQLRGIEQKLTEDVGPSEKLKNAEEEIQLIVNLHKKIAQIQSKDNLR